MLRPPSLRTRSTERWRRQRFVGGVEQRVFLQAPAAERRRAERQDARTGLVGAVEPQLDFAFEGHTQKGRVVDPPLTVMHPRRGRRYSFRTVTKVSCPLRRTSRKAVLPSATCPSRRLASAGEVTSRRFTCRMMSPRSQAVAEGRAALFDVGDEHALGVGGQPQAARHVRGERAHA